MAPRLDLEVLRLQEFSMEVSLGHLALTKSGLGFLHAKFRRFFERFGGGFEVVLPVRLKEKALASLPRTRF